MPIACIGGVNLDIKATTALPVVAATSNPGTVHRSVGGVAANIATNLARLAVPVSLASAVGDDGGSGVVLAGLVGAGVDTRGVLVRPEARTASYIAVLDSSGELVVAVADMSVIDGLGAGWVDDIADVLGGADVWVLDANLSDEALSAVLARRRDGVLVAADPASAPKALRLLPFLPHIDMVFPDMAEASALSGIEVSDAASAAVAAAEIAAAGVTTVVVKLGGDGVCVHGPDGTVVVPAIAPTATVDVTGAGDALVAGYIAGMVKGCDPVIHGLAAASLTVESAETTNPSLSPGAVGGRIDAVSVAGD